MCMEGGRGGAITISRMTVYSCTSVVSTTFVVGTFSVPQSLSLHLIVARDTETQAKAYC